MAKSEEFKLVFAEKNDTQREFDVLRGRIIVLEASVASGKTCLARSIVHHLKERGLDARCFAEFFSKDLLDLYLSDRQRYGFSFQIIMAVTRIERYRTEIVDYARNGGIAVVDRFAVGDNAFERMLYKEGLINEEEHRVYWAVMRMLKTVQAPDYTVYLKCTPETCLDRVKTRGIESEVKAYNLDFFRKLQSAHEEVYTGHQITTLDYNERLHIEPDDHLSWGDVSRILHQIISIEPIRMIPTGH